MQEEQLKQIIREEVKLQFKNFIYHTHNSVDGTPRIDPDNFAPFRVYSAVPTDASPNGIFKLVYDGVNYRIYFRINNLWKYAILS